MTRHPKRRDSDQAAVVRPPESRQLYPVPPGEPVIEGLRSDFVALERMLPALQNEEFTGYLRVHDETLNGVVLLNEGQVIEALFDIPPAVATGHRALSQVASVVLKGEGVVDLFELDEDMVISIYQLLTAPTIYSRLFARFVDVAGLIAYLSDEGINGSVVASNGDERGIMLFRDGVLLTAYTSRSNQPDSSEGMLMELFQNATTEIEVRGGPVPDAIPALDLLAATESAPLDRAAAVALMAQPETGSQIAQRMGEAEFHRAWTDRLIDMLDRVNASLGTRGLVAVRLLEDTPLELDAMRNAIDEIASMKFDGVPPETVADLAVELRGIAGS
jgi:hypothetical protein